MVEWFIKNRKTGMRTRRQLVTRITKVQSGEKERKLIYFGNELSEPI